MDAQAYKKMSLELHPDKNKSPTAAEDFARLKDAYDVSRRRDPRPVACQLSSGLSAYPR